MPWLILHVDCDQAHCPTIEEVLLDSGAASVTLQDSEDQPLFEPTPGETPLWQQVTVSGLFDAGTDLEPIVTNLRARGDLVIAGHRLEILEDKDWVRSWMDDYQPLPMGERLWICPSWLEPPDRKATNLILDPGMAFGTGTHPTTAMCLRWLDGAHLEGSRVIYYGCGSGILAIAALLLGATEAVGTDIDPQALQASRANAERNGIPEERLQLCFPQAMADVAPSPLLVANILAGPLASLAPQITPLVQPGGSLLLSGILAYQGESVMHAYPAFSFALPREQEGWLLLEGRRNAP